MNVSFGANTLYKINVKRMDLNTHKYKPCQATFVELDPASKDLVALSTTNDNWNDGLTYLENIVNILISKFYDKNDKIYALTSQTKDFKNLNPNDILGVALVNCASDKYDTINFIQTNPSFKYSRGCNRDFKNIGKAIIRCLKKEAKNKGLKTITTANAMPFYKKYGFVSSAIEKYTLYWNNIKPGLRKL